MPDRSCLVCQGPLALCNVIYPRGGGAPAVFGMETEFFSLSGRKRTSAIEERVCVDCGYLMSFAATPGVFREELGGEKGTSAGLPIPHAPAETGDDPGA